MRREIRSSTRVPAPTWVNSEPAPAGARNKCRLVVAEGGYAPPRTGGGPWDRVSDGGVSLPL